MRSSLSEQVYAAAKTLPRQVNDQQKAESTNREQEKKKQAEQAAQQLAQKKPQWLGDWKKKLIDDLNRTHYGGNIPGRNGVQYTGILGATPNTLTMLIPYGKAEVPWSNLAPASLLAISTSFIKPNAPDAADRQWLCAVYASETNQADAAKKLAEDAGKSKPEYQQRAALLFSH